MKVILCVILLFLSFLNINAQSLKTQQNIAVTAKVDQRVELLSIVARLAEYDEYVNDDFKSYAADTDKYFAKYKQHPAIEFAKKVRESNGVGFDAIASMAVHLNPNLTPKIAFSDVVPDKRWGKKNAEGFAKLLQKFYKDTNCETFFKSHAEIYKLAENQFQTVVNKVDFNWYKTFYGEIPKGSFNLYIGLLNGGGNFGPKVIYPNGKEELFAIMGTWKMDEKGMPLYDDDVLSTIIHEFNHSFINHLVHERENEFRASGEKIFQPVADKMAKLAYGNWKTVLDESLVRTAVVRYMYDHQEFEKANKELILQRNLGFLWIEDLFVLFGTYENSRKTYPTFRSFIPLLEGYTADFSKRVDAKVKKFEDSLPKVVSIENIKNGAEDVDFKLVQMTINFDRPLSGNGYSINLGEGGKDHFPIEKVVGFSKDRTQFTVQIKLKPDWEYSFIVTGLGFSSPDGYPLQNYTVKFKTRRE